MASVEVFQSYGDDAFSRRDYESAISFYTSALSQDSVPHTEILKARFRSYYEMGCFGRAFDDMVEIQKVWPSWSAGYVFAGKCLTKMKCFTEAVDMFCNGLKIDPENAEMKEKLAEAQKKKNEEKDLKANPLLDCSLEAYPTDNALIKQEMKDISNFGHTELLKPKEALGIEFQKSYINDASLQKVNGNFSQAVASLKSALQISPTDWGLWHILCSVYYQQRQLEEAIRCCDAIPKQGRQYDTWLLGGKIRQELGFPVSAELWFRNAANYGGKRAIEARQYFQNVRVARLYDDLTLGKPIKVKFGDNGRAMYATDNIKEGTIVFREQPIALAQTVDSSHINACSSCGKNLMTADNFLELINHKNRQRLRKLVEKYWPKIEVISCERCQMEIYCSERCRTESWRSHHWMLCKAVNAEVRALYRVCEDYANHLKKGLVVLEETWSASFSPMLLARIWAGIVSDAKNYAKSRGGEPSVYDWAKAKAPYRRFIAVGECSYARAVPKMVAIMKGIFENRDNDVKLEITEKEFDGRYFQVACNVQAFVDPVPPFKTFKDGLKQTKFWKELSPLLPTNVEMEATFAGLFSLHSTMNHACDNNIEVHDDLIGGIPGVAVYAKRDIAEDEEVTTTYIDTRMSRRERRERLHRAYNFWCQCRRCLFEGDDGGTCTACGKHACAGKTFLACSRCHRAWYCSTKCQKSAWKAGHKYICRRY